MMSEPPRSSLYLTPAPSSLSVSCVTLSSGTPTYAGTHVGAPAHCATAKMSPAAAAPTTRIIRRFAPPIRSNREVNASAIRSAHRDDCSVRVHQLVAQLDQHLERDGRFLRGGHHLMELHRFAAHEALDVVLRRVLRRRHFIQRALERVAERRTVRIVFHHPAIFAGDVETNAARAARGARTT